MKALIQRVRRGAVRIEGVCVGRIGSGYVVLLGVRNGDTADHARALAHKTTKLRIFSDEEGRMNRSIEETGGEILVISQFTLYANTKKGHRPSFIESGDPDMANELYQEYVEALRRGLSPTRVQTGRFAADMDVEIINDGPVTIELCTD